MAEIKNPKAYFKAVVQNSYKNECRSNDNYFNHVSSVGDEADIQRVRLRDKKAQEQNIDYIERALCELNTENWLLFMENERLHTVLSSLPLSDVKFLLELAGFRFNKTAYGRATGVSQQAVSRRYLRLREKILENL
jgi:DNA-directed RNA polymerase specialized sigma24 family protein